MKNRLVIRGFAPLLSVFLLAWALPAAAQRPDAETVKKLKQEPMQLLEVVHGYLTMVADVRAATADPLQTQIIVQHDMKEIYEKLGKPEEAVKEFRRALEEARDPSARIALRMTIADVLKSSGKTQEALEEMRAILAENKTRFAAKR